MIKFDKGVPLPSLRAEYRHFNLDRMEIGDSFFLEDTDGQTAHRMQSMVSHLNHTDESRRYITRRVDGGIRTWRLR